MKNNLFVRNLSWDTNDDTLLTHFEKIGEVKSAKVILDRETGKSRGFGFVEMINDDAASDAINQLDNSVLDDREIRVDYAREKSE